MEHLPLVHISTTAEVTQYGAISHHYYYCLAMNFDNSAYSSINLYEFEQQKLVVTFQN